MAIDFKLYTKMKTDNLLFKPFILIKRLIMYVKGYHVLIMESIRKGCTVSVKNGLQKGNWLDLGAEPSLGKTLSS